ncbi:iron dicitrate transport regulator FecR [Rhizobium sp. Root268]|nr:MULTISPECIES: FecR family protein [unclassified Rhizobium]KQV44150.1 iron dicitrate transport regulator FecR [Rhizobium sp. Root1212]KRD38331.1 iron dicitrate transport regulator FecR [Rhizobium sp. Root268]
MTRNIRKPRPFLIGRRTFIAGCAATMGGLVAAPSRAGTVIGTASDIRGDVQRKRLQTEEGLSTGAEIMDKDRVATGADGFADLTLEGDTRILLGNRTELLIDSFIANQGGTMELGMGQMVFDRPEGLPKIDLAVRTAFGMIGVRGTKFFCGPTRGVFGVFVEHGQVAVEGGGVTELVGPGDGVEIARPGEAPNKPVKWKEARIVEAYASVGLKR